MFTELIQKLHAKTTYTELEKVEEEYKQELIKLAEDTRYQDLLDLTKEVGFLFKQKSYGVKCSLPTGYSIFLFNPNEGFSYQRHESFKIELFHFLKPDNLTFCYLAPYNKFLETNKQQGLDKFHLTKIGSHEKHCINPKSGDVVLVKNIGDVHTVIGGIFEEFANTSLDHVTRLYDQNKDRVIRFEERRDILNKLLLENYNLPSRFIHTDNDGLFNYSDLKLENQSNFVEYTLFSTQDLVAKHLIVHGKAVINTSDKWYSVLNAGDKVLGVEILGAKISLSKMQSVIIPRNVNLELTGNQSHAIMCGIPQLIF